MGRRTPDFKVGEKVGQLTIVEEIPIPREKQYKCECVCGTEVIRRKSYLRNHASGHCNKGACKVTTSTHGESNTRLYSIWSNMKGRIANPVGRNRHYLGLSIDSSWKESFISFKEWAELNGYTDSLTIDRIDNTVGYYPDNCRWTTNLVQSQNRGKHHYKDGDLPKGVYKAKPRSGKKLYSGTGHSPYYWIVIYKGKRHQQWGFTTPTEAYNSRVKFIKEHYDDLVIY